MWTEHKRIEKLHYMHRNPVKRGLVASPELWSWSSFRAYAVGEAGPVKVNDWEVLKMKIDRRRRELTYATALAEPGPTSRKAKL